MRPTICAAIIARNEERDLPKCIASLVDVADKIVVIDTGSTDNTRKVALDAGAIVYEYFDACELNPDKPGEWRIVNFAAARNHAIERAEESGCSHVFWIDCDDVVVTPLAIRRAAYLPAAVYSMWVELGGGTRQAVPRLWPASYGIRYKGWVHEYQVIDGKPSAVLNDCCIRHDATPHESAGEDSNARNLRILTKQYEHEPDARTAFYLANTHKDGGRWAEAARWYHIRLGYGDGFADEHRFAVLYLVRCLRRVPDNNGALSACIYGLDIALDWQELRMELAYIAYDRKQYALAIEDASKALDKPIPPTVLWREPQAYRDQPARLISWSHEHLGNRMQALVWSQLATRLIGAFDADWSKRESRLALEVDGKYLASVMSDGPKAPAIVKGLRRMIALHRPGAIGDILMTLNLIPAFKAANPDADVHYFCDAKLGAPDALGSIMIQAGVDAVMDCANLPQWRGQYERVIDLVGYPIAEGYPEKPMRRHLLQYFAEELGLDSFGLPALTLRRPSWDAEFQDRAYVTVQKHAGWSKYKQWGGDKWEQFSASIFGSITPYADVIYIDEKYKRTLAESIAIFANARMHIGIDSFCNHLTNYYWTDERGNGRRVPGVILWGSTQASAAGYPDNTNISLGLACQPCFRENPAISRMPRGPCINPPRASYEDDAPHACMGSISVDRVVEAVRAMWEKTK